MEWIDINKKLPPMVDPGFYPCLICRADGNIRQSFFNTKTKMFQSMNFDDINDSVTHWMPLPEPPKTETK